MAAPRDGRTDHLLKYGGEENIIPHDSQVFYSEYANQGILKWEEISVDSDRVDINYEEIDWNASYARLGGVGLLNMGCVYRNPSGFGSGCSSEFSAGWWSLCQRPRIPRRTLLCELSADSRTFA